MKNYNVLEEIKDYYENHIDWEPNIRREWTEKYFQTLIKQGLTNKKLNDIWHDIYAFSKYIDRVEFEGLQELKFWEYSLCLEWVESHIFFGNRYELTLRNAKRFLKNLIDFYNYLISIDVIKSADELHKAWDYICDGRRLNLVTHIPFTGEETWTTIIPPNLKAGVIFYVVDFWLMIMFLEHEQSWDKLIDAAKEAPSAMEKMLLIKNFKNKLAILNFEDPRRIQCRDVSYADLYDAKGWFEGKKRHNIT